MPNAGSQTELGIKSDLPLQTFANVHKQQRSKGGQHHAEERVEGSTTKRKIQQHRAKEEKKAAPPKKEEEPPLYFTVFHFTLRCCTLLDGNLISFS